MRAIGWLDAPAHDPDCTAAYPGPSSRTPRAMNVHHLELFYYVARHGGISAAVRHIPYGIQQPAVSGQMRALEESAGARLFERSPFRLTPAGEHLFRHIQPFFEGLAAVAAQLPDHGRPTLRVGGSELVLRDHLPEVMSRTKRRVPGLQFSLRTGLQTELEDGLRAGELDLALTLLGNRPPARLRRLRLARIPAVLLVPRRSPVRTVDELVVQGHIREPLITLPEQTLLARHVAQGLRRLGLAWSTTVEADSLDLITRYVANGDGFGVALGLASVLGHRGVRALALPGVPPVTIGALWRGEASGPLHTALEEVQRYSRATWPDAFLDEPLP